MNFDGKKITINGVPCVAFLCDQQADCKDSIYCGDVCQHTLDIRHAKNFKNIGDKKYMEGGRQNGKFNG